MKAVQTGKSVIETQLDIEYESSSWFKDIFSSIMGTVPTLIGNRRILKATWLDTKLGPMIAITDEKALYLLEFVDCNGAKREIERLCQRLPALILPGKTSLSQLIEKELTQYFDGELQYFTTPLYLLGSPFQKRVWEELRNIPYEKTCSYADLALSIGKPAAFRAVANANGANQIALIIPCHRVINKNSNLGGYKGGIGRKKWLITHEQHTKF